MAREADGTILRRGVGILRAVCDEPMHGYGIIRRLAELTGNLCVPTQGTVYPVLREFEECGRVRSRTTVVLGRERKVYAATAKGRRALEAGMDVSRRGLAHRETAVKGSRDWRGHDPGDAE